MRKHQVSSQTKFKGLNTTAYKIQEDEFRTLTNVQHTPEGTLIKRPPIGVQNNPHGLVSGDYKYLGQQVQSGGTIAYYFASTTRVYKWSGAAATEILLTGASIPDAKYGVQAANGDFYIFRTAAIFVKVTAAGVASNVTSPTAMRGDFGIWFKNRLWTINMAGSGDDPYKVFFSSIGIGANTVGNIGVGTQDAQPITAITVFNDQIWVFKTNSIWLISVDGEELSWFVRKVSEIYGCLSARTPIVIDGLLYFWSRLGIIRTDGQGFDNISIPINTETDLRVPLITNPVDMMNYGAYYIDNKYILQMDASYCQAVGYMIWYVYDIINECWVKWTMPNRYFNPGAVDPNGNSPSIYIPPYLNTNIYAIRFWRGTPGQVDVLDTGNQNIAVDIRTAFRTFEQPTDFKRHAFLDLELAGATGVTITYQKERVTGVTGFPATMPNDVAAGTTPRLVRVGNAGRFRELQTRIQHDANNYFELQGIHHALLPGDNVAYAH